MARRRAGQRGPNRRSRPFAVDLAGFLTALRSIDPADGPRQGKHNWFRGGTLRTDGNGDTRTATTQFNEES